MFCEEVSDILIFLIYCSLSLLPHAASIQLDLAVPGPRGWGEISSGVEVGKQEEVQTAVAQNDPAVNLT